MYQAYWQLTEKPFENTMDPRFYYPSASHQGALLKLRYGLENHAEAVLVAGEPGMGKTLLAGMLCNMLGHRFRPWVEIGFPQMSAEELIAYLADALEPDDSPSDPLPLHRNLRRIRRLLDQAAQEKRHPVVVLEDAHLLTEPEWWEAVRLLLNFRSGSRSGFSFLLAAQPSLLPLLERMPSWRDRIMVQCLLRPFNPMDTSGYVGHRLKTAGATRELFEPKALDALHQLAQGVPRRINRLADLALLVGYAEGQDAITAEQIEAVAEELLTTASE
ncbi:MAG TPA: AAA family ATPase [Thermoguttaceae bacterium]|nr:AAA family ATPase [Thermoguttaceae bacterium]